MKIVFFLELTYTSELRCLMHLYFVLSFICYRSAVPGCTTIVMYLQTEVQLQNISNFNVLTD